MEVLAASLIAVAGTLLGSVTTYLFQRQTVDRAERFARQERLRQERMAVYGAFAGAVTDHRRAVVDLWFRRAAGQDDPGYRAARSTGASGTSKRGKVVARWCPYAAVMERADPQVLVGMLAAVEDASPVDAVEAVTRELGVALGARTVSFLIADLSGRALVRLAHVPVDDDGGGRRDGDEVATVVPFDGGLREQALRTQTVQVVPDGGGSLVLAPVTERGEVIGLLEVGLPGEPPSGAVAEIARTAHALAFVVIANRRHTDLFEWGQRTTPFTLSAEIQRRLLPGAFTCEAGALTLSGWLEPAASVGGDTFDYSLARDVLHFSVTDAMGHGVASALTACLCVGSLRNGRRRGTSLVEQAETADVAVGEHAPGRGSYVTAILGRIDLRTGVCSMVNAGHLPPLLVRDGRTHPVTLPGNFPLGMFPGSGFRAGEVTLRPGDRLAVVTDGVRERKAATVDLSAELASMADLHPREAVRELADAILAVAGPSLPDDATLLFVDWHGGHGQPRNSASGADPDRASPPLPD